MGQQVLRGFGCKLLWPHSQTSKAAGKDSSELWNQDGRGLRKTPLPSMRTRVTDKAMMVLVKWSEMRDITTFHQCRSQERAGNFWGFWPLWEKVREHLALPRPYAEPKVKLSFLSRGEGLRNLWSMSTTGTAPGYLAFIQWCVPEDQLKLVSLSLRKFKTLEDTRV